MNDEQKNWKVAHLDEIERRGRDIPVREHLGIHSFGINVLTAAMTARWSMSTTRQGRARRSCTS